MVMGFGKKSFNARATKLPAAVYVPYHVSLGRWPIICN